MSFNFMNENLISLQDPKSPVSEAYRTLRTNIQFSQVDKTLKTIVVTSAGPGEGKSSTTSNTAITFAQAGGKTLIIDADLRKPMVHKLFGIDNRKGLTNILALHEEYEEYIHRNVLNNLDIITCGAIPPNPSELLASKSMKKLVEELGREYDHIFIDAPPVGVVTDAAILSIIADGVIIVSAAYQVERDALRRAKELLDNVKANILGVVLNKVPRRNGNGYYYYYYYSEDTGENGKQKKQNRLGKGSFHG